jgi:BASS family bile acid:Na+ symporter
VAIGVLIIACMPCGTTSTMFTYFSRGNLALSVLMTIASTVAGIVLIPVLLTFYAGALDLQLPTQAIALALALLTVPIALGLGIRQISLRAAAVTERIGAGLGVAFIVLLIVAWVPRNAAFLMQTSFATYIAAVALGLAGIVLGYVVAALLRLGTRDSRTIAIETGLQNGPLAFSIIAFTFPAEAQQSYMAVPALYSFFIVIVASMVTLFFRASDRNPSTTG